MIFGCGLICVFSSERHSMQYLSIVNSYVRSAALLRDLLIHWFLCEINARPCQRGIVGKPARGDV